MIHNLRSAQLGTVQVDFQTGLIRNASVITCGPAVGHGFEIDVATLSTLVDAVNNRGGKAIVRFKHPEDANDESLGTDVGFVSNLRIEGDQVRGDVQLQDWAKCLPGQGDVWTYLLTKADKAPETFGLSVCIDVEYEIKDKRNYARVLDCTAVDFVGQPAANPNGLLSRKQLQMEPELKLKLIAYLGLQADISDEQAQAIYDALTPEEQSSVVNYMSEPAAEVAPEGSPEDMAATAPEETKMSAKAETKVEVKADKDSETVQLEEKRIGNIRKLAKAINGIGETEITEAIAKGFTVEQSRNHFLTKLGEKMESNITSIKVGDDKNRVSLNESVSDAIRLRSGVSVKNANERAVKLSHLSLVDIARHWLAGNGVSDAFDMSRVAVAEMITSKRARLGKVKLAQAVDDFDYLLVDAANKSLRAAYTESQKTWNLWARRSTNPDFKAANRIVLSESPTPTSRNEGQPITYTTLSDGREQVTLTEYASGIRLTRKAIINDDLDAFNRIPQLQAAACARLEDDAAYGILTANANLADGGALFNATAVSAGGSGHANYVSSGTALTVANLAATEKLMLVQQGPKASAWLELKAKYLLVPTSIYRTAQQLIVSTVDPSKSNATVNPFANEGIMVIPSARLNSNSTTAWYLVADYNQVDTVEVCFLQDEPEPTLKSETEFDTDDVKFSVRHTVGAKAIDFRGMVKNAGA